MTPFYLPSYTCYTEKMEDNNGALEKEVSAILLRDWDPLEVADFPEARTEYEKYAAEIVFMHQNGNASAENIYNYLKDITERSLRMKAEEEPMARATENIIAILTQK